MTKNKIKNDGFDELGFIATKMQQARVIKLYTDLLRKEGESDKDFNFDCLDLSEQIKRLEELTRTLGNYNEVLKQNKKLQTRTRELERQPFFPFAANSGMNRDYGDFILISHAWFSALDEQKQVGVIEVEWKNDGRRCIYLGIGSGIANDKMFDYDVNKIAHYGSKLRDSGDVV